MAAAPLRPTLSLPISSLARQLGSQDAVDLLSARPFVIDHDQTLSVHGTVNYTTRHGVWIGRSIRYDSGLVADPSEPADVTADPDFADLLPYVDLPSELPESGRGRSVMRRSNTTP